MTQISLPKVFERESFVSPKHCEELVEKIHDAPRDLTTISAHGSLMVKGDIRRTSKVQVPDHLIEDLFHRFQGLIPSLQDYFGVSLLKAQLPQVLRYQPGDFYKVHKDNASLRVDIVGKEVPPSIAGRKITAVLFLNEQVDKPHGESFEGGELVLHSKTSLTDVEDSCLPILSQQGKLVAFPSSTLHEVIPVVSGIRYSVVSWFE